MRGISYKNLKTHYLIAMDTLTGYHKSIEVNSNGDKYYYASGFEPNIRITRRLTLEEVNSIIEEDKK